MPLLPEALPTYIKKSLLALATSVVFLGLIECGARLVYGPPSAPVQVFSGLGRPATWFTEKDGWVNANFQFQNTGPFSVQRQQRRFAVFGGSSVHGGSTGVGANQEFAALLGEKVGAQAVNLGSPSVDSHDITGIVHAARQYPVDAWVIYTGHNDFGNTYFHQRYRGWSGGVVARMQGVFERLQLYWQLRRKMGFSSGNTAKPAKGQQFSGPAIDEAQKARALRHFGLNLQRIVWEAKDAEVPLVLVVPARSLLRAPLGPCIVGEACGVDLHDQGVELIGGQPAMAADLLREASDADSIPIRILSGAQDAIRDLSDQPGVYVVDAPRLLPQQDGVPVPAQALFQDHLHLSSSGHQQMAVLIAPFLRKALSNAP